jgi:hypothetical protein
MKTMKRRLAVLAMALTAAGSIYADNLAYLTNYNGANLYRINAATGKATLVGSSGIAYEALGSNCGATLPPEASCTIRVTFTPTRAGFGAGVLTIHDGSNTRPRTLTLSGTGQ